MVEVRKAHQPHRTRPHREGRRAGTKLPARRSRSCNLDNPFVVSSPRKRALVTAELAGLTVDEVNPLISEWDYGDYEGTTTEEIRKAVPNWLVWTHGCPGGETAAQVCERADQAIAAGVAAHGVARRRVRRARPLLPRGAHPLDRAAAVRGDPVRDGRRRRSRCAASNTGSARSARSGLTGLPQPAVLHVTPEPSFVLAGPRRRRRRRRYAHHLPATRRCARRAFVAVALRSCWARCHLTCRGRRR